MKNKAPLLEEHLHKALSALGNQIARELQRDPKKRAVQGYQKWEPIEKRVELLSAFFIEELSNEEDVGLEPLLILCEASAKALQLFAEEVGSDTGEYRGAYLRHCFESIADSARRGLSAARDGMEHFS